MTAKGWYPDPVEPSIDRFWDGEQWTSSTRWTSDPTGLRSGTSTGILRTASGKKSSVRMASGGTAAFLVVVTLLFAAGNYRSTTVVTGAPHAAASSDVGKPVRDGQFEFLVSAWEPTTSTAYLTVRNIGTRFQPVSVTHQYLYDKAGRQFRPEFDGESALAQADLDPGQTASGSLTYHLGGAVPDHLDLHDSAFSDGVEVSLG